jgi:hypothetical protein
MNVPYSFPSFHPAEQERMCRAGTAGEVELGEHAGYCNRRNEEVSLHRERKAGRGATADRMVEQVAGPLHLHHLFTDSLGPHRGAAQLKERLLRRMDRTLMTTSANDTTVAQNAGNTTTPQIASGRAFLHTTNLLSVPTHVN